MICLYRFTRDYAAFDLYYTDDNAVSNTTFSHLIRVSSTSFVYPRDPHNGFFVVPVICSLTFFCSLPSFARRRMGARSGKIGGNFGLADVGSFGLTRETTCSIVPSRGITMRPLLSR